MSDIARLQQISNSLQQVIKKLNNDIVDVTEIFDHLSNIINYANPAQVITRLPKDLWMLIESNLPLNEINKMLRVIKLSPNDENYMWYLLFNRDFNKKIFSRSTNWKNMYKEYHLHWILDPTISKEFIPLNQCIDEYIVSDISDYDLEDRAEHLYATNDREKWKLAVCLELAALAREEALLQSWFITTFIGGKNGFSMRQLTDFQNKLENSNDFFDAILSNVISRKK